MERNIAGITGLAHIGWTTEDRDGAMALLCDAFGVAHGRKQYSDQPYLAEVTGFADCAINIGFVQIEGDTLPLELLEYVRPQGAHMRTALGNPGAAHICFETDDITLFERKLAANGIKLLAEPRVMGFGPWRGRKGAFFAMPDGLIVELIENRRENAEGRLTRLHHVGYSVSDTNPIRRAFCDIMGLQAVGGRESTGDYFYAGEGVTAAEYIAMPDSGFIIELLQCAGEAQEIATNMPGNVHLCWMTDDILAAYKELEARGLRFVHEPGRVTAGVNAGAMAGYLRDPHEVRCEFFQGAPTRVTG